MKRFVLVVVVGVVGVIASIVVAAVESGVANALTLAGVVVACATTAIGALLWKSQLRGQTQHDLAKRLSMVMYQLGAARGVAMQTVSDLQDRDPMTHALLQQRIRAALKSLPDALDQAQRLEWEADAVWGEPISRLVRLLRVGTSEVTQHVDANLDGDIGRQAAYSSASDHILFSGTAFPVRMAECHALLHQWLGVHVGRVGSRRLGIDRVERRLAEILARTEQLGHTEWCVEHDAWMETQPELAKEYEQHFDEEQAFATRFDQIELATLEPAQSAVGQN